MRTRTVFLMPLVLLGHVNPAEAAPRARPDQIVYEYVLPTNPDHRAIHAHIKEGRALEHLKELLSPLRLPYPLKLKVAGCDGVVNAFYYEKVITVCYELLADILKNTPRHDLPISISKADAVIGSALDVFLHETGHALFNMLQIPILGREEDAADQFAAYIMLRLGKEEARKMILGSVYQYAMQMRGPVVAIPIKSFSSEHSLPAQRAYNVMCIAYGADKKLFADLVENELLPKQRAESCDIAYEDLTFAMDKLISPHVDKRLAKTFHQAWRRTINARRARLTNN